MLSINLLSVQECLVKLEGFGGTIEYNCGCYSHSGDKERPNGLMSGVDRVLSLPVAMLLIYKGLVFILVVVRVVISDVLKGIDWVFLNMSVGVDFVRVFHFVVGLLYALKVRKALP